MGIEEKETNFDVIIIGAGISGVCAAYRLQEQCPERTYTILEARDAMGGTWDYFKFPGIRSDSDLHTFGFPFHPWTSKEAIASADSILKYMQETTALYGIDKHIRTGHKVQTCNWSSDTQGWTVNATVNGESKLYKSQFVVCCAGYYNYEEALTADIPGLSNFEGTVAHPQFWPKDLDYTDKDVVIVGSGATAITVLPTMAKTASHATMLQRSPTYIVAMRQEDPINKWLKNWLPQSWAFEIIRWKSFILPWLFYKFCQSYPKIARAAIRTGAEAQLPKDYPISPNFEPKYNPWEQRMCLCPDGDFYKSIRQGKASVITDTIKTITEKSIILESGAVLHPDIIVTATGLKLQAAGGAKIFVDGKQIQIPQKHMWKGMMLEDVPNAAIVMGYGNASWTLGADATAQFTARLLNYLKKKNLASAVPTVNPNSGMKDQPSSRLKSTYYQRGKDSMPKAGDKAPWKPRQMYILDLLSARYGDLTKDMKFTPRYPATA